MDHQNASGMDPKQRPAIDYRPFEEGFLDPCIALYVKVFSEPPWNETWTEDSAARRLRRVTSRNGFIGLVAYDAAELVGFILGNRLGPYPFSRSFHFREMLVAGPVQGTGIGRQLLETLMGDLRRTGFRYLSLVTKKGSPAEQFFAKMGFRRIPRFGSLKQLVLMRYSFRAQR